MDVLLIKFINKNIFQLIKYILIQLTTMQIWLHQLDGTCTLKTLDTPQQLLEFIQSQSIRFVSQGSNLDKYNIQSILYEGANVYVTGDLEGGKKKKKKKVYTTKKKNKHIHRRVKMGIYSLYSVDGIKLFIQEKATSPNNVRPAPHADLELSWHNTGIATIVDSVIQL